MAAVLSFAVRRARKVDDNGKHLLHVITSQKSILETHQHLRDIKVTGVLELACEKGYVNVLEALFGMKFQDGQLTASDVIANDCALVRAAVYGGCVEVIKYFLEGMPLPRVTPEDLRNCSSNFVLRASAELGHDDLLEYLLAHVFVCPEDVSICDNYALRRAAFYGHTKVVERLAPMSGIDAFRAEDHYALRWAVVKQYYGVIDALVYHVASKQPMTLLEIVSATFPMCRHVPHYTTCIHIALEALERAEASKQISIRVSFV